MFSLPSALQALPASRRLLILLPLPLAVTAALAWPQEKDEVYFPPVPTLADQEEGRTIHKQTDSRKAVLPRRDPFRPLNHPALRKSVQPPAPASSEKAVKPAEPAAPAMPHRLLGILTVKGEKRALVAGPRGTTLLAAGEELPGKGTITSFQTSSLTCGEQELAVGEVWR